MKIVSMYLTMVPLMLGGITNMLFTKTKIYKNNKYPIDMKIRLWDGKRLFGDNKTYIGFLSMVIFVVLYQVLWGLICNILNINGLNTWYKLHQNKLDKNIVIGLYTGIIYMLCELPNSFVKRRLDIPDGKTVEGLKGAVFFIIDQIDSLIGVFIYLAVYSNLSYNDYLLYVFIGGVTHITINIVLHRLKVRKNI